jgi:hypothetical protein
MKHSWTFAGLAGIVLALGVASTTWHGEAPDLVPTTSATHEIPTVAHFRPNLAIAAPLRRYRPPSRLHPPAPETLAALPSASADQKNEAAAALEGTSLAEEDRQAKARIAMIHRIGLDDADRLEDFANDPNSQVRTAAMRHLHALQAQYEAEAEEMRAPPQSGRFVPKALDRLQRETDRFALQEGLDFVAEYAGKGDIGIDASLQQLLQRPDLDGEVLLRIAELQMENFDRSLDDVNRSIHDSPSFQGLSDYEVSRFQKSLEKLDNSRSMQGANLPLEGFPAPGRHP